VARLCPGGFLSSTTKKVVGQLKKLFQLFPIMRIYASKILYAGLVRFENHTPAGLVTLTPVFSKVAG
jgi:hypothetical protein